MAEFTEVMKQALRMCKDLTCVNCPVWLEKEEVCGFRLPFNPNFEEFEKDVMEWAEENPEKSEPFKWVYPSWEKAWKSLFPDAVFIPCPSKWFGKAYAPLFVCAEANCDYCKTTPMHPEIADKLDIAPIGRERKA